ncbi:hypothetical protein KXJ69_12980 [Aureisphaera sp. CAU 1614]|uniref:Uncharacterized protein n=1 Tax=Halomarinibacterium sedimenti TaxID=2857106 RepID=A0A9X1FQU3_9FLAO|nr:hypothetical protein [Halomarinibacterium sedimenti]MBW2939024.1 hypothetical protein [Halomarinibacterium sedimenti]
MKLYMQLKNNMCGFLWVLLLGFSNVHAQEVATETTIPAEDAIVLLENEENYKIWLEALEEPGVKVEGNTMSFSFEAKKLIADVSYRNSVYKSDYTFEDVAQSLKSMELQKAFWQMITMYPNHKQEVVNYIFAYDQVIPTDKVVSAAFYTYAFFDPQITEIVEGKPNVLRPDIFEAYLKNTNEIMHYIKYLREQGAIEK